MQCRMILRERVMGGGDPDPLLHAVTCDGVRVSI